MEQLHALDHHQNVTGHFTTSGHRSMANCTHVCTTRKI